MSSYKIQPYTFEKAKRLGVRVRPSENPRKKVDVLDWKGNYILSIGDPKYMDYELYLASRGKAYADDRRRLYAIRHSNDISKLGSGGYYSWNLLWRGE
jgi:hypothetical protein